MPKFEEGDYVTLREDARYPLNGSLWSTINDKLVPGELFRVNTVGRFSWDGKPEQDCVGLANSRFGWIPEICLDPVQIHHFEEGEWVECYRLPNENDWTITKCGKISHSLIIGGQYKINDIANNSNIKLDDVSDWYPPTIFRKMKAQQLPKKWCVACKDDDRDTPELLEWRNSAWVGKGFIGNDRVWQYENGIKQIISYETFLELVYKPWKSIQPIVENLPQPSTPKLSQLPEKWVYSLENESADRLILINEWRRSVCYENYIEYHMKNSNSVCNHYDDSYFYSNSATAYRKTHNGTIISKEMFDELILQPWIDNGKPSINVPDKKAPIESPPSPLDPRIVTTPHIGARVVRGRDWEWGPQDGGNGIGTIIENSYSDWVRVKWDNKTYKNSYRIGDDGKYDLYYYEPITNLSPYYKEYPPDIMTTKNYSYSISECTTTSSSSPKLIINKPKKRLLSTEVQEFNVNLNLLKTP